MCFNDGHMQNNFSIENELLFGSSVACILKFKIPSITLSYLMLNFTEMFKDRKTCGCDIKPRNRGFKTVC